MTAQLPPLLVVDVANVMGARGDGWWRDPAAAAARLLAGLAALAHHGLPGAVFGLDDERVRPEVVAVLEGRARSARAPGAALEPGHVADRTFTTVSAAASGDDEVVAQVRDAAARDPGRTIVVATSDRQLRNRVAEHGARCIGGGRMRALIEQTGAGMPTRRPSLSGPEHPDA